ncbi:hypothetical protein Tco_1427578 [Tanacetum coccineum]
MVAFLQKLTRSDEFHQIVDFLADSHIMYALTANPTIYAYLIEQFWQTGTVKTVNNGEQHLYVTVDGQTIAITEASVRRNLNLKIEMVYIYLYSDFLWLYDQPGQDEGPSSPGGTQHTSTLIETSPQLQNISNTYRKTRTRRMGIRMPQSDVPSSVADEAIIKEMHDGLVRATTTASSLEVEQGSGNIAKTQTKATSSGPSSPRKTSQRWSRVLILHRGILFRLGRRVSTLPNEPPLRRNVTHLRSREGSMQLLELINLCTKLSDKVTSLEDELASTKAVYNKKPYHPHQRVKKLENHLKQREESSYRLLRG